MKHSISLAILLLFTVAIFSGCSGAPATQLPAVNSFTGNITGNIMVQLGVLGFGPGLAGKIGEREYLFVGVNNRSNNDFPTIAQPGLLVLDIQNPSSPQQVSYLLASDHSMVIQGMELSGTVLYVSTVDFLWIIDVSNPSAPRELSKLSTVKPLGTAISGHYAYINDNGDKITVVDISHPAHPQVIGNFALPLESSIQVLKVSGSLLFALDAPIGYPITKPNGLYIIDISSPRSLKQLSYFPDNHRGYPIVPPVFWGSPIQQPSVFSDMAIVGNCVYMAASGPDGMLVLDISNPSAPKEVADLPGTAADRIAISGNWVYLTAGGNCIMVDITNPQNPQKAADFQASSDYSTVIDNHLCLLINQSTGPIASTIEIMKATEVVGVWQFGRLAFGPGAFMEKSDKDYLFVGVNDASRLEFQAEGTTAEVGITVVDVTNFDNPQQVAYLLAPDKTMVFQGMELAGNLLYVSAGNSFWIVDVSDPSKPKEVSRLSSVKASGATIFSGRAFINDNKEKITIVGISDPAQPRMTGNLQFQAGIQVLQSYGSLLFVISIGSPNELHIIDSSTLKELGHFNSTELSPSGSGFSDIAVAGKYAYLASQDGMLVLDISDPANPREIGRLSEESVDHILIMGNLLFLVCGGQYELLDVSDAANPKECYGGALEGLYTGSTEGNNRIYCLTDNFIQVMN